MRTEEQKYLAIAVEASRIAGEYLFKKRTSVKTVDVEKAHDIKLSMDRYSEHRIVQFLKKKTSFSILSEEAGMIEGKTNELCWVVDPLDGTINYFRQIPLSCVSIGLYKDKNPVLGVIYDFYREEMFTGIVNQAAYLNGQRIYVSATKDKRRAVLTTGFPGQMSLTDKNLAEFCQYVKSYRKVRLLGTAALSMAYVACGRMDAYIEKDIMLWDVGAGRAIIEAAGGKCRITPTQRPYCYDVKASNGILVP